MFSSEIGPLIRIWNSEGDEWRFSRIKKSGEIEREKWGIRGRKGGEKDKQKQQKYKWSKKENLHFRLRRKKKDEIKKTFFSVFYRFLAFFSVFLR